jgi:hypothetical protein
MEILQVLSDWPVAVAIRQSPVLYPLLNAVHILALGLLIGSIATLDLRLLGVFPRASIVDLAPPLWRMAGIGLGLAVATGFLLFSVRAPSYAANPAFILKLGLVTFGLLNAAALHANPHWRRMLEGEVVHGSIRISAALSLLAWTGAIFAGRWIGFLQD